MKHLPRRILLAAICTLTCVPLKAQTYTWIPTAAGTTYNWNDPANWTQAPDLGFPNGLGVTANYNIDILGNVTARLQQDITLGTLNIGDANGSNAFGISSGTGLNTLFFESATAGGNTAINLQGTGTTTNTISANVTLGGTSSLLLNTSTQILTTSGIFNTNGNNVIVTGGVLNTVTWNVNGDLIGNGTITTNGLGGINVNNNLKSFTGTFILNRGVSGASNAASLTVTSGSLANTSEVIINGFLSGNNLTQNGGGLHSGSGSAVAANPGQRLPTGTIRLNGGSLAAVGQAAQTGGATPWTSAMELVVDNVNVVDFNSGTSLLNMGAASTTAGTRLNITTVERSVGASAFVRGSAIGATTARVTATNGNSFLLGAGGPEGSQTMSIIPWMGVNDGPSGTSFPIGFGTNSANGFRALTTAEYATSITAGSTANVSATNLAISSPTTVNSLRYPSFNAAAANIGDGQVLTITSGGLFMSNNATTIGQPGSTAAGTIAFGSAEAVIWSNGANTNTIGSILDGTGGLTKAGSGTLVLAGLNTYTGLTVVGSGTLQVGDGFNASNLGLTGDVSVAAGATLSLLNGLAINDTATLRLEQTGLFNGKLNIMLGIDETVGALFFNNGFAPAGTYGSTISGATFQNDDYFSGSGVLTVVPEPGAASALLGGVATLLGLRRRRV